MPSEESPLPNFDALWNYDDPASTEAQFRALLPTARASGDTSYLAQLLTQIARAEGLQRQFEAAHATLDEAETLLSRDLVRARVRYGLERGRVFRSAGQVEQARPWFEQAREQALAAGADGDAVDAIHMLAIIAPPEQGQELNRQAIELAEQSADPSARRWLPSLYYNTGWTLHDQGRADEALAMFDRAADGYGRQEREDDVRVARWCAARMLRAVGRYADALEKQADLQREYDALGRSSGFVYEELGENLLALNRLDEARPYFTLAHAELTKDPFLVAEEPQRLQRLQELGGLGETPEAHKEKG